MGSWTSCSGSVTPCSPCTRGQLQSAETFWRATRLYGDAAWLLPTLRDLQDQYQRVGRISDSQLQFPARVTEYYRARTDKMAVAGEKLAVNAAVTLPVSAVSRRDGHADHPDQRGQLA